MLTEIAGLPENVFGVRATGEVNADDLKSVLLPGLKKLVDRFGEIRYLLVLDTDVKNFTAGAWVQDAKAGLQNFSSWKKIAVLSHEKGVEWFTDVFTMVTPGSSKGFKPEELKEAKAWLTEE
ncbi:STAS/SEC14 domain-containing protein [Pedobacter nototheniae]|uniref:STAS/SEC14 domain-containing protein n=1 Tax=Pedobacter nototheniae TaxID=2488994 RepID=UPI0029302F96|nr:STAS/SEC14 domain-containing protein [Pedobacter nototheniae]